MELDSQQCSPNTIEKEILEMKRSIIAACLALTFALSALAPVARADAFHWHLVYSGGGWHWVYSR